MSGLTNGNANEADGKHVLLVDDYPDALEVWKLLLESFGYDVALASNGVDALDRAAACTPDVVIIDLQLPDLSGVEVGRRLRAGPQTADATLIALTGRAITSHAEGGELADVFDAVFIKPCEPAMLLAEIARGPRAPTPPRAAAVPHA